MNSITKEAASLGHTELAADNASYIEALYEQYLNDPDSVDTDWQTYFEQYKSPNDAQPVSYTHLTLPTTERV